MINGKNIVSFIPQKSLPGNKGGFGQG